MECNFSILIVDDEPNNIYSLKLLLDDEFEDLKIYESNNAKEAILTLMENEIDLILSDIMMPEIDGFDFVKYLQTIEELAHTPIILISGILNDDEHKKRAYLFPEVVEFISKPIDDELLISKLRVFVNIFKQKKLDKKKLLENESIIRSEKNKIDTMIKELSKCSLELSEKVKKDDKFIELMQEEEKMIDLDDIIKESKKKQ